MDSKDTKCSSWSKVNPTNKAFNAKSFTLDHELLHSDARQLRFLVLLFSTLVVSWQAMGDCNDPPVIISLLRSKY